MSSEKDPAKASPSEPQFQQTAASGLTAGGDIQIGQIVQKIVNLGLPFNSQHLRFVQFLANTVYASLLLGGFWRLWQQGADEKTLLMLILGGMLLSLTGAYYAWFWKPKVRDKRSRQFRRLAMVACVAIPLLTGSGFFVWSALPPPHVLVLVANFANSQNADYRDDRGVSIEILEKLQEAARPYADVKVQALDQMIRVQDGSKIARSKGEQRKAAIVIWGNYVVTNTHVQISVYFERLKSPKYFPELEETTRIKPKPAPIAELDSVELQIRLSSEIGYLTLFTLGMAQYAKGDLDGAITRFSDALAQINTNSSVLNQSAVFFYRGTSSYLKSDYPQAIADLTQGIKLQPDLAAAYINRGNVYHAQGNHPQAIADFNQAIQLKPDFAEAYNSRGDTYSYQGNYPQAIADFNQALKLKPDYAEAYNNRGATYLKQGNDVRAIADFNQALKLKPDHAEAHNNLGIAHTKQGNYPEAIRNFTQAIKLKPDLAEAYMNRGNVYHTQGNYPQAIADYTQIIKLRSDLAETYVSREPDLVEGYINRGIAYKDQGNYPQAIRLYRL